MAEAAEQRGRPEPGHAGATAGVALGLVLGLALATSPARAADIDAAEALYRAGRYDEAIRASAAEIAAGSRVERWHLLKIRSELARGAYPEAMASVENALRRQSGGIQLLLVGRDVLRLNGRDDEARAVLDLAEDLAQSAPARFATPEGRVALGRILLARGTDAKKVLDACYDAAIKARPEYVEAHLASAELALDKQDNALAAATLEKAPKAALDDPRTHYLLALAFSDDDRARSELALAAALKINPGHVDSLLLLADHRIDSERYDEAAAHLAKALEVNPNEPRAHAYRAVLAHLRDDEAGERAAHDAALSRWATNPGVDHLIGRELSRKYRFAEGAAYQRRALAIDADYLPARVQLCQDLLRLGDEDEGWRLADAAFAADGYNVLAYNLITLRDRLAGFKTLEADGLVVRMDPREAALYGPRVLALLARARRTLAAKYGATIAEPVVVEIFPQKKEFAVRTFGLPGVEGFLGVCFGRVITANSPASQGETPSNWEAVLWHEYCHVVTLSKTRNKMPRWLSEGISVYEEGLADPSWRGGLDPKYRAMILGDELTPLSRLSSAFLEAKSGLHIQFAYQESALAVEFLVKKAGIDALKQVLDDLGAGRDINEALAARAGVAIGTLDAEFAEFARAKASEAAPGATFDEPELPASADTRAIAEWVEAHPGSFPGVRRLAAALARDQKWDEARAAADKLLALYPAYKGPDNAHALRAAIARKQGDAAGERAALEALAAIDGDAGPAYLRLMELESAAGDWAAVDRDARRMLAVNPLVPAPFRRLAEAAEKLGRPEDALEAYRALALVDESDPAETHYRMARLLKQAGRPAEARREVLKALEEAPRFLDAHRLLLELAGEAGTPAPTPARAAP